MPHPAMDVAPPTATPPTAEPAPAPPRGGRRAWLQYAVIAVLFAAVALTLQRGWSELESYHWSIDRRAVAFALGVWMLTNLGSAVCWLLVTRAFGVRLPIGPALRVFCTSNLGKYLPGKVVHVLARVYLVQQQGVPVAVGTTSAMLDVLLYIGAGVVLSVFALPTAVAAEGGSQTLSLAGSVLAVAAGVLLLHPRALNFALGLGGRFIPRLRGLRFELRYRTILAAFALYLVLWLLVVAAVYAGVRSVFPQIQPTSAPMLGAIFALSYVTGLITPTPAGVGGREAVMIALFPFFMPAPAAVVATILNRLLQVVAEALSAGLLSLTVRRGSGPIGSSNAPPAEAGSR